jgi:3',5'-cyclic AMP phosphodiesterase CpdA
MYPMSASQINWLKNDMNASDAQWKIVLTHRALYSAGKNINKPDTVIMRNLLLPVIDELGIDVVFAGHDHMYFRTETVKDEKVQETETITEVWNGKETTFTLNPDGTTHILPSTAGTKRYSVNEEAMPPILESTALARDTHDGGVFATVRLDSEHFVYEAYMVNDETQEKTLIDSYAIKKTERESANDSYVELPTDRNQETAEQHITTFVVEIFKMIISYFKLLFSLI